LGFFGGYAVGTLGWGGSIHILYFFTWVSLVIIETAGIKLVGGMGPAHLGWRFITSKPPLSLIYYSAAVLQCHHKLWRKICHYGRYTKLTTS